MARGAKKRGGGGGGRGGGARKGGGWGGEKYKDEANELLGLDDDDASEGGAADSGDELDHEVMAGGDEEAYAAPPKKEKGRKRAEAAEDEELDAKKAAISAGTAGWRGQDFYGGEDAGGDTTDGGSEEELTYQEAKRLEDLRAKRLGGLAASDPMAVLLGGAEVEEVDVSSAAAKAEEQPEEAPKPAKAKGTKSAEVALAAAGMSSQFESVFEAQAETSKVARDLSQLSEAKRRALVKKEAPELAPLLEDYRGKLESLREMLPLLQPEALAKLPKSGAVYLQSKAALLLNTLANLAFYVLLRAEGGSVRTHPVVSQLVWLKELQEKLAPLDTRLRPKMKKAAVAAKKALKKTDAAAPDVGADAHDAPPALGSGGSGAAEAPRKLGLRERLERARAAEAARASKSALAAGRGADFSQHAVGEDLLKLPSRRKPKAAGGVPADLEEDDPTVGAWLPKSSLSEQLQFARQYEASSKPKKASADMDVEARPRRKGTRLQEDPDVHRATVGRDQDRRTPPGIEPPSALLSMDDAEEAEAAAMFREAKEAATSKKEKKSAAQAAKEEAKLLRQYRPEDEVEGRRKTSKRILNNRGLVRQRKVSSGNARVVNRGKYDKMVKRRRGAVQEMREAAADGATYEGEATGLRTHVKKSKKLG